MSILSKIRSYFGHDNKTKQESDQDDYAKQLKTSYSIYTSFIYMNDELLASNNNGSFIWYIEWDRSKEDIVYYCLELLSFLEQEAASYVYTAINLPNPGILISLDLDDIQNLLINLSLNDNILYNYLKTDVELNIPQSFITNDKLNTRLNFKRTTLDGKLDDDFKPITTVKSIFPIKTSYYTICGADKLDEIYHRLVFSNPLISTKFKNYAYLSRLGKIHLQFTLSDNKTVVDYIPSISNIPYAVFDITNQYQSILDHTSIDELINDITDTCKQYGIIPKDLEFMSSESDQNPDSEDSNEEIIEDKIIKD